MTGAIGIRLPGDIMEKIREVSKDEYEDRSTTIRKLLLIGYRDFIKKRAADRYKKGEITISEAARQSELTIWEMERYLIEQGFRSDYSIDDLEKESGVI
ncbi:UPF0175 family protein [Candidatus Woesearchaeota archaeon]|nr:UPF0175 family protein [Candidatus Woesearchaeota archaeon]